MDSQSAWLACLQGALRVPVAFFLLFSARAKIKEPLPLFEQAIEKYRLAPRRFVPMIARLVIASEILIGILLLLPVALKMSGLLLMCLSLAFLFAQLSALARGLKIDCGCKGSQSERVSLKTAIVPFGCALLGTAGFLVSTPLQPASYSWYYLSGLMMFWLFHLVRLSSVPFIWILRGN